MGPMKGVILSGYVRGDALSIVRQVRDIPAGRTITKAWFTVKTLATDADPGVLQKVITTSSVPGVGHVIDAAADGFGELLFILTGTETATVTAGKRYHYDIQLKLDNGDLATIELGTIQFTQDVTAATT